MSELLKNAKNTLENKVNEVKEDFTSKDEKRRVGMISKTIVVAIAFLFLFFAVRRLFRVEKIDSVSIPVVKTTTLKKRDISKENSVMGTIMPGNTYPIINKVAGEITEIFVENGQYVKKGDKICTIDNQKQIDANFIQYDTARKSYERMEKLYQSGDISKQSYEQVKAQYDSAKLAYDTQVEYATPTATADGIIQNTNMTVNVSADAKTILCYITSLEAKEIQFGVTERVLDGINLNDTVYVEKHGKKYEATISDKAELINQQTGLFNIKATIKDENAFASGVMAKVTFIYQKHNNVDTIERDIVYYESSKPYVYVVDDKDVLHKKFFDIGIENNDYIEVLSGLSYNDKIVSTWNNSLAEGVGVEVIKDENSNEDVKMQAETETLVRDEKRPVVVDTIEETTVDEHYDEELVGDMEIDKEFTYDDTTEEADLESETLKDIDDFINDVNETTTEENIVATTVEETTRKRANVKTDIKNENFTFDENKMNRETIAINDIEDRTQKNDEKDVKDMNNKEE